MRSNKKDLSTVKQIRQLWRHLLPRRKKQLLILLLLMIICSFAEVLSIGAVLPFLGALTSPEKIFTNDLAQPYIQLFKVQAAQDLLLPFTLIFVTAAIFAGLARIALLWVQTRLSMAIGVDFSVQAYERTLYQPYSLHVSRSSSEILSGASKADSLAYSFIQQILIIISSIIILAAVTVILFSIQPFVALSTFIGFGFIYATLVFLTRRRIAENSQIISVRQVRVTKAIQEGLGGIRDILIGGKQSSYSKLYKDSLIPLRRALAFNQVAGLSPRFGFEALGMVLVAALAYVLATSDVESATTNAIPVLGALALGAQRVLPLLQQIYYAFTTIKGNQASTQDALDLLDQPMPEYFPTQTVTPMAFQFVITLNNLSFRYKPQGPWVLRHLNFQIAKGSRVGFVGVTGSGKSTLLDISMGLLTPSDGELSIDGRVINSHNVLAWQANISHVPQSVYLSDSTIAENIAFGVPSERIDLDRVRQAAQRAQIAHEIETWCDGYHTFVGERGVQLSGGQRQRIGLARALYMRASVIILDEATSALDNETEAAVMRALETLERDITILIIAHRLTTLNNCDQIVEISNGGVKLRGDY